MEQAFCSDQDVEEEMLELARLVQHNAAVWLPLLEVEDMLLAWMDLPQEAPVLHLPPASPYFRMLIHRLVDMFGVTHISYGEGEERHIVLQKNEDSRIPSTSLSDILDESESNARKDAKMQILRRSSSDVACLTLPQPTPVPPMPTLEERQRAYEEARARIFSQDPNSVSGASGDPEWMYESRLGRERRVPIVAQRLIGHALGMRAVLNSERSEKDVRRVTSGIGNLDRNSVEADANSADLEVRRVDSVTGIRDLDSNSVEADASSATLDLRRVDSDDISDAADGKAKNGRERRRVGCPAKGREQLVSDADNERELEIEAASTMKEVWSSESRKMEQRLLYEEEELEALEVNANGNKEAGQRRTVGLRTEGILALVVRLRMGGTQIRII